jgi:hypothetical protein
LLAAVALSAFSSESRAETVGVAAAVNPDAFSSLSGAPKTQLNIGKSIFFNERINTTTSGLVQVLLVDGSTFTVGPGSDLVIDKFVYDPTRGTGEIAVSFSKGVMRFVGGKISKRENAVKVKTPAGTVGMRGCIVLGRINGSTDYAWVLVHGVRLSLADKVVFHEGYGLFNENGRTVIRVADAAVITGMMASLSKDGSAGGTPANNQSGDPGAGLQQANDLSNTASQIVSNANTTQILGDADQPTTSQPQPVSVTARVLSSPGVYTAFPGSPDSYTTGSAASQGILGGGSYPPGTPPGGPFADDFTSTFSVEGNRLVGTLTGLIEAHCAGQNCSAPTTSVVPDTQVNFPWFQPNQTDAPVGPCVDGICAITDATTTQGQGANAVTTTYTGLGVAKPGFFAYQVTEVNNDNEDANPVLAFGGDSYNFGTPTGRVFAFDLQRDIGQNAFAPFASADSMPLVNPDGPQPSVSQLLYLEQDSNPNSRAVWLQTSFYINTTPQGDGTNFDQQSVINVALGGVDAQGGLVGARRGGASVDSTHFTPPVNCDGVCGPPRETFAFTGDIASLASPNGSHFLGSQAPNIVVGIDSTSTPHNIGRDVPLVPLVTGPEAPPVSQQVENQSGATYHIGVGSGPLPQSQPQFQGMVQGYAVGMVQSAVPVGFTNVVASTSPDDFNIAFDPVTNSLFADVIVRDVQYDPATSSYEFKLGDVVGLPPSNKSAYIDNLHYAAIEADQGATTIRHDPLYYAALEASQSATNVPYNGSAYTHAAATTYLVSGDQIAATSFFPDTFEETAPGSGVRRFCTNCEFLKWGAWGARAEFGDGNPSELVDHIQGWWVAGNLASAGNPEADLDKLKASNASATYTGNAIGNVAANINNNWKTYVAAGDVTMKWYFGPREGTLAINNFDANGPKGPLNLAGKMRTPGEVVTNQFGGSLQGTLGGRDIAGHATGSFVNNGPNNPAAGVIGNFNVGGNSDGYKATGVFAGSGTPVAGPSVAGIH